MQKITLTTGKTVKIDFFTESIDSNNVQWTNAYKKTPKGKVKLYRIVDDSYGEKIWKEVK